MAAGLGRGLAREAFGALSARRIVLAGSPMVPLALGPPVSRGGAACAMPARAGPMPFAAPALGPAKPATMSPPPRRAQ
jgi:hypothetical protein